jgi:hypothetical protein
MLQIVTSSTSTRSWIGRSGAVGAALLLVLAACGDPDSIVPSASPSGTTTPNGPGTTTPATTTPVGEPGATTTTTEVPPPTTTPGFEQDFDAAALRAELEAARQRWAEHDFRSYTFEYSITCFCPLIDIRVGVIEGRLVETNVTSPDGDVSGEGWGGRTVDEWFDEIDRALGSAFHVDATFDEWGYPVRVYIDEDAMMADEEYGMTFEGFADRPDPIANLVNQPYPCGYGFWTATPTQGVSVQLGFNEAPTTGRFDVADLDIAEVRLGKNLMANWCDDVMEEGEPIPEVTETWVITAGTLDVTIDGATATATITGLVATTPDGTEIPLGDGAITNDNWGMFAG